MTCLRPADGRRHRPNRERAARWLKFNAVGVTGFVLQLAVLQLLAVNLHVHYLLATALAVEAAIVNNFFWHQRVTWKLDSARHRQSGWLLLMQFNLSSGIVSLAGNLVLMRWLVGQAHWSAMSASIVSVLACSLVNFAVNDLFIFSRCGGPSCQSPSRII